MSSRWTIKRRAKQVVNENAKKFISSTSSNLSSSGSSTNEDEILVSVQPSATTGATGCLDDVETSKQDVNSATTKENSDNQQPSNAVANYSPFEMHVLTSLEELHQQQKIISSSLQRIMKRLEQTEEEVELPSNINLPISKTSQIDEIEEVLKDEQTKKILTSFLAGVGGRTVEENVRRVLSKLVTNEVATQINWTGKGWKRGFHNLRLNLVVQSAVKRNSMIMNATEARIGQVTRDWFKYAKDRGGGRKMRELQNAKNNSTE